MLTEEGSRASMLPIYIPEVIRSAISLAADNLMPFPFWSLVHSRFLSTVSQFGLRLAVPPFSPTNAALIHTQFLYLHRAIWHSSDSRAFSSVVRQMPESNPQRRDTVRTFPNFLCSSMYCLCCVVLCIVCVCVCVCVCKCVLCYCHRVATQLQLQNVTYSNGNVRNNKYKIINLILRNALFIYRLTLIWTSFKHPVRTAQ